MNSAIFGIFLYALSLVESAHNPNAIGAAHEVGILQITPVMVQECNRIAGYEKWSLEDRLDPMESYAMAESYFRKHGKGLSWYEMARIWNQGVSGYRNNPQRWESHDHATRTINLMNDMIAKGAGQ